MITALGCDDHPAACGFFMPPEWAAHERCWMSWPVRSASFSCGLPAARRAYAQAAQAIAAFEPVTMLAPPDLATEAAHLCGPSVTVMPMPISDSWVRDNGPSFLVRHDGAMAGVAWGFNAWGGNYEDYAADAALAPALLQHLGLPCYRAPLVMEGGAFHVDGQGTLLTTEECLLNPNRNPSLDKAAIEQQLRHHLGVSSFIWLSQGYDEDETDGHIDEIACFIRPGLILAMTTDDKGDPNYARFQENAARLRAARDSTGRSLDVVFLPTPHARREAGRRLTLSYTNFYLANGGVILPGFDDPMDAIAVATFQHLFPERHVIQIPALDIVRGGGGLHCITQQQPSLLPPVAPPALPIDDAP
jgi:agmatine deiminase